MMRIPRKAGLLLGCALGAVAGAASQPARAQSFDGTPTVVTGVATVTTGPGNTSVFVSTPETVINWTTLDPGGGPIDFQPAGTTAVFTTAPGNADYTVLNRILPVGRAGNPTNAAVAINGTVLSLLVNDPGGHIWFYSPNGIIAGPTATFNVGSLILTTNDIAFVPNPAGGLGAIYGPGGLVQFSGPADSTGYVDVRPGAQLNARGLSNPYIALVAPRVVQGGLVQSNGQVAYLAAEQLDMTINAGMFDFTLQVGTTDPNGVVHTGTTTGPASTGAADLQRISMVALPKNDALTMLLSGSVGYTPAASAAADGSAVVLAADFASDDPATVPASQLGSIEFGNVTVRNALAAYASDMVAIAPSAGTTRFEASSTLYAANTIDVIAQAGESVIALGDLSLNSGRPGTGGTIGLQALAAAEIRVAGTFSLRANSNAASYDTVTPFLDAQGGQVSILADGGTISAPLAFAAEADGRGAFDAATGVVGTGGTVDLTVANGGIVESSQLRLSAIGLGGASSGNAGTGTGGTITVADAGGQLDVGNLTLSAGGVGGNGAIRSGDGAGGSISIAIAGEAQAWNQLLADASGQAGAPIGTGASGNASASADAVRLVISGPGALDVQGVVALSAGAVVGLDGAAGYTGTAGGVELTVSVGGALTADSIALSADARFRGDVPASVPTTSAVQRGGVVTVLADGGTIGARFLTASASAVAREASASPGSATGGTAQVTAIGGGSIQIVDPGGVLGAGLQIFANGHGAPGALAADSFGGTARLSVEDGSISVLGDIEVSAEGTIGPVIAPPPGAGFNAAGGNAIVELLAGTLGTGSIQADNLLVSANGDARLLVAGGAAGGDPVVGEGGDGTGGLASVTIAGGSLTAGRVLIESAGIGGTSSASAGAAPFASGDGFGGSSVYTQSAGAANLTTLDVLSDGMGGGGAPDAAGPDLAALAGDGTGGLAALDMIGGTLDVIDTTIAALGTGGAGMGHTGAGAATDGGAGTGGTAALRTPAGASGFFGSSTLAIRSNGIGGAGGTSASGTNGIGGDGTGYDAAARLADGSFLLGSAIIEANGTGGDGATGGTGTGGQATFAVVDSSGPTGARALDNLTIAANGIAGLSGGLFPEQSDAGDVLLDLRVLDALSGVVINGSVELYSRGGVIGAPSGVTVDIAGAPLNIGGNLTVEAGDIDIAAGEPLLAAADAFLSAERTFVSTGLVGTDGFLTVQANLGVTAERLSSGGNAFLSGGTGPLVVADLASAGEVTAYGASVDIRSLGALQFASATATAGDLLIETVGNLGVASLSAAGSVTLETSAGDITTGDLAAGTWSYVDAFGSASLGNIAAGTDAAVTTRGGNLTVGNVTAGDDLWLSIFGADDTRVLTAGNLVTTGLGSDTADGPPVLFGGPGPAGNVTRVRSSGSLAIGDLQSTGRAILVADAGTATAGDVAADQALIVLGRGNIALGSVLTGGRFYVADSAMFAPNLPEAYDPASLDGLTPLRTSGGLTIGSTVEAGDITVAVAGTATAPSWTSVGGLLVDAGGQFVSSAAVSAGGNASVTADAGIDLAMLNSGGTTLLRSPVGSIEIDNLLSAGAVTARGRSVGIASTGGLTFVEATATAGNVAILTDDFLDTQAVTATDLADLRTDGTLHAAGDVAAATIDLRANGDILADAGLLATNNLSALARGTFTLVGLARGTSITVASGNIALGTGASLGSRGSTNDLTLTNLNVAAVMNIGGTAQSGYSLDQAEAARLFADDSITFGVAALPLEPGYGRIAVGDLALTFGATGNIGTGGQLEISTPAQIAITGDVALTTSGPDDTFLIDPTLVELDSSTGSIALLDIGGNPLGRLNIVGDTIAIASTGALAQLPALTDMVAINALLDTPGGAATPLRAGDIALTVDDALFIQNSGASAAYADRRGFAANGLEITTGSAATRIAINGQILTPAGAVSGLATAPLIRINGAVPAAGGQFDALSTINGCVIGRSCAPPQGGGPPTREDIDPIPPTDPPGLPIVAPLIELVGTEPLITPPLVDEPITGVGNDDLWEPRCDPDENDRPCPDEDGQP